MPKDFTDCVKNGGKIVTKQLKGNRYLKICYDKNGNSYSGEIKRRKTVENETKAYREKKRIEASKELVESLLVLQKHFNDNYHE